MKCRNFALMILQKLSIVNYKNLTATTLTLSPKINCLIGQNGAGKTNLLDAIYYLSFCRSAFTNIDAMIICHEQEFSVVEGSYLGEQGEEMQLYCGVKRGQKKHFKRNKKEYKRLSQHLGVVPLIFVSPSDSILIEGGSEERRRLMDIVIAQLDVDYVEALSTYNKALKQRNSLLKQEQEPDPTLLDVLEQQMAYTGEKIYHKRTEFIKAFLPVFQSNYEIISGGKETVGLTYVSHCQRGALLDVIQQGRPKDRIMGYSLHGIHRDELELTLDGYPMKHVGSQGQSKTFALALKLSQFSFLKQTSSKTQPLLLLDDVFDKLDAHRVEAMVRLVSSNDFGQIFMTDTNREHLDQILRHTNQPYKIFTVDQGNITESEVHDV